MTEFKKFRVGDLFEVVNTNKLNFSAGELPSNPQGIFVLPALTAGIENQGLSKYVPIEGSTILEKVISVSANGANTGKMFYQPFPFTVLQDAYAIKLIVDKYHTENIYLYTLSVLQKAIYGKFSWDNKAGWNKVKNLFIQLPVTADGSPDWKEMESFIDTVEQQHVDTVDKILSAAGFSSYADTLLTKEEESLLKEWLVAQTKSERSASAPVPSALRLKLFKISELFEVVNRGDISNQKKLVPDKNGVLLLLQGNDSFLKKYLPEKHKVFKASDKNVYLGVGRQTGSVSILSNDFMTTDGVLILGPVQNVNVAIYIKTMLLKIFKNISYSNTLSASDLYSRELYIPVDYCDVLDLELLDNLVNIFKKLALQDLRKDLDKTLAEYKNA